MNKNNINIDMLLKSAMSSMETPDPELVRKIKYKQIKEESILKKTTIKRSFSMVATVVMAFVLITTTAFAALHFLKSSEVADKFEDNALSAAFDSETAVNINESITSGNYTFTLLAVVSGKDITNHPIYYNGDIRSDRTYAVVAIRKADGSPMPATQDDSYGNPPFYVSPYVKGLKPWEVNANTMKGGHSEMVVDGVMYRILACDTITMFAGQGVYLGINTGSFYDSEAFIFDEVTGELKAKPDYDGSSVVFDLPIDKSLADTVRAEQYLSSLNAPADVETAANDPDLWNGIDWDKAVPVSSTKKELRVADTGVITFTYDFEHGSGTVIDEFDNLFTESHTAQSAIVTVAASDDTLYAVRFSMDENGVITGMVVMPE